MVASSSAIGALFAIGGHNSEVVIVADEGHLVFYSSKTMLKIRSQRVSDARIVGITAATVVDAKEGPQHHVHAVDTTGNYFVVDVTTNYVLASEKMTISAVAKQAAGAKPVVGTRATVSAATGADAVLTAQWTNATPSHASDEANASANVATTVIVPEGLRVVLLTPNGVFANNASDIVNASGNKTSSSKVATPFMKVLAFPGAMSDLVMAVGVQNGLIAVGQRHRTWLWLTSASQTVASAKGSPLRQLSLPARLMSVAVTPVSHSTAFAMGGDRGEIAFYPTANIADSTSSAFYANNSNVAAPTDMSAPLRFFSDHWHSTSLQAVAFTEDGRSLLSGAAERALVAWSVSGAFTRTRIMSSRREELTDGYLWKSHTEAKIDKKSRFRPKVRRNGEAEGHTFITTDVATIIIPFVHGAANGTTSASSPFANSAAGCYVVGVSGQVAAMDLREQKVASSADGVRWSMSAVGAGVASDAAVLQRVEAIEWMGRPALLLVSAADSEIRVVDPITQQSLYTHHVRFNMETSLVHGKQQQQLSNEAGQLDDATASNRSALHNFFNQNKAALDRSTARGTVGALLAAVAEGGRTVFTYEDLSHLGLDAVLRVWRYVAEKQRHVEVQAIHNPHPTEVLQMRAVSIKVPRSGKKAEEDTFDTVTMLFTMDRVGVKCWRSVELPRHESRSGLGTSQRNFLHLGGSAGANGDKEADAFMWRVVGSNRCPSGRGACFELSEDGTVILVADEVVRAYEVPTQELAIAFAPGRHRAFAVADWEPLFTLRRDGKNDHHPVGVSIDTVRFIADGSGSGLPAVFGRFADGCACCWQANADALWSVAWESSTDASAPAIHTLLQASTTAEGVTLAVATEGPNAAMSLCEVTVKAATSGKEAPTVRTAGALPTPTGAVQYVLLPTASGPAGSSSYASADAIIAGRLMALDAAGVRHVPIAATTAKKKNDAASSVETFAANVGKKDEKGAANVGSFFSQLAASAPAHDAAADSQGSLATSVPASAALLAKVLGSEAYAAPPMSMVLSSLLSSNSV